jgi:hypothetical protein
VDYPVTQNCAFTAINLGGEGEAQGVINQQRPFALSPGWSSCIRGYTLEQLANQGLDFLICRNEQLPIQDDSMDLVITNAVPIDILGLGGPGVQSSEIRRILRSGGQWIHDGRLTYTKP